MSPWLIGFFSSLALLAFGVVTSQIATLVLMKGTPARLAALSLALVLAGIAMIPLEVFHLVPRQNYRPGWEFSSCLTLCLLALIPFYLRHTYWPSAHNWINLPATIGVTGFILFLSAAAAFA